MIKKLRRKFIIITMCSLAAVLAIIMGAINITSYVNMNQRTDAILDLLIANNGNFPKPEKQFGKMESFTRGFSEETPYETRFFTVLINEDGAVSTVDTGSIAAIATDEAVQYGEEVYEKGNASGFKDFYRYKISETDAGTLIVFLDCSRDLDAIHDFFIASVAVSAFGIFAVFILVLLFSKKALKPVAESYEKQKRFITDAGHEIKTPLTVIDANIEVLELENGSNQWTQNIRNQIQRLAALTASLIALSRMEENENALVMVDFSLSDAVTESVDPFTALAKTQNKKLVLDIDKGISCTANEQTIRQLVAILADNALKYGASDQDIRISLKRQGKYAALICRNGVDHIELGDQNILFERFYRADASHSSQIPAYGLGLSIAKAIVLAHKGKISAKSEDGKSLTISVMLKILS